MPMMQAVRIHGYGGVEQLCCESAQRPSPAEGQVLVRVHASAANPFDLAMRAGYLAGWYALAFPLTLGLDVAGVVEELGAGVEDLAPGAAVYARADPGSCGANAEYVVVNRSDLAAMPGSLSFAEAAALPHSFLSAWRVLVDAANLAAGQRVLIHAAAGGVGSVAVQLAKARGAYVIGTASASKLGLLLELGADEQIDYTAGPFEEVVRDVDVVMDTVGGETQARSWGTLKPGGILLSLVQPPDEAAAAAHGVRQQMVAAIGPALEPLEAAVQLVEAGRLRPVIDSIHPLEQAAQAHALVAGRHTTGRVVLQIRDA